MEAPHRPHPVLPALLAWLVPGAGHLKIGRLWPGIFTFAAILPLYVGGMALAGFDNVSPARHPVYFFAVHVWGGLLTAAATLLTRGVQRFEPAMDRSVGELFTAVACLLNLIAILDVWARCSRGDPEERLAAAAAAAAAADSVPSEVPAQSPSGADAPIVPEPDASHGP